MQFRFFAFIVFSLTFSMDTLFSQEAKGPPSTPEEYKKVYKKNILKTKINGIYIPKDLNDAHQNLEEIGDPAGLKIFKSGTEEEVAQKLRLGLGRWIELNWSFYEGSRLSHYFKEQGLLHPADMSTFIIRTFHRKLLGKPLGEAELIEEISKARRIKVRKELLGDDALVEPPKE